MAARHRLTIGLVAHDERKKALVEWATRCADQLARFDVFATGTTGSRLAQALPALKITRLRSGPLGGDQQLGALIAEQRIDALIFFVDPLSPHPHDVDVKALIRLATLANILFACNQATADAVMQALRDRGDAPRPLPDGAAPNDPSAPAPRPPEEPRKSIRTGRQSGAGSFPDGR